MPDPQRVRAMFARIAPTYDSLNRFLSLGIDQRWRRRAAACLEVPRGGSALDVCCGTGDLAFALARAGVRVLGLDFTPELLLRAEGKRPRCDARGLTRFGLADALRLPLRSASFDGATIAFGLRNVADRRDCLLELQRVVRPGGRVVVLEFQMPRGLLGPLYRAYFTGLLPLLGRLFSRDPGAYSYLPASVLAWPSAEQLEAEMAGLGFEGTGFRRLTLGIVALHWGRVPGQPAKHRSSDRAGA